MADETTHYCTKRRRKPNWSELQTDLLESILLKMSFIDILRFKAVCSSWYSAAEALTSSSSYTQSLQTPLLMLPLEDGEDRYSCRFLSLAEKKVYKLKNMPKELREGCCVGSSHGWLVLLDQKANPYLLNPFSRVRIQLPSKESFPCKLYVCRSWDNDFVVGYSSGIAKAILSSDPSSRSNNNCGVIAIYDIQSKLAFCKCGDSTWTDLNGMHRPYNDIICYNNQFYALADNGVVEVWDFHNSFPTKRMDIEASPTKLVEIGQSDRDLYSTECYLVESLGDLLHVVRLRGEFVGEDGGVVHEADLLSDEDSHPLICPYKTLQFYVYKLDLNQKKWVEMESLGDRVLFLGGNHSVSLSARDFPECIENSIYFTKDYWDRMNEGYLNGAGHDLGVFNLEDKTIKPFYQSDLQRIQPPLFWVVPNPW